MKNRIMTIALAVGMLVSLSCSSKPTRTQGANTNASSSGSGTGSGEASGTTAQTASSTQPVETVKTIYTDLSGAGCGAPRTTSEVSSERTCSGVEGYKLLIQSDDDRDSITIITPDGRQHPLKFWETISKGAFSSLGQKAEWRIAIRNGKDVPIALIVRVEVQAGDSNKTVSYLSVSKISDREICVTDRIDPGADQNEKARVAADFSANKKCLSGY